MYCCFRCRCNVGMTLPGPDGLERDVHLEYDEVIRMKRIKSDNCDDINLKCEDYCRKQGALLVTIL